MGEQCSFTFPSADGIHTINACCWPTNGKPRAIVQIVHGIAESMEDYAMLAEFLNAHGFAVIGHDHLGHGKSISNQDEFGCFPAADGWEVVNQDIWTLRELTLKEDLPYFLLGHSMGSLMARQYLIDHPSTIKGCILTGVCQENILIQKLLSLLCASSALLYGPDHISKFLLGLIMAAYRFRIWRSGYRSEAKRRNARGRRFVKAIPTVGMFQAILQGMRQVGSLDNVVQMDKATPIAILSGAVDPVGKTGKAPREVYRLLKMGGCRDVFLKIYPGVKHAIFRRGNFNAASEDVLNWLEDHLS